jgi:hypothetical protein
MLTHNKTPSSSSTRSISEGNGVRGSPPAVRAEFEASAAEDFRASLGALQRPAVRHDHRSDAGRVLCR